jgi:uncharacterized protein (DUF427 family)
MNDDPDELSRLRESWLYRGQRRPDFATPPGPGQESVWDYPRPPVLQADTRRVTIHLGDICVADTTGAMRLLETAGAPCFYLPPGDVQPDCLQPAGGKSLCEWKGQARYFDVLAGNAFVPGAAWSYPGAREPFEAIAGWFAFYPADLNCRVAGERVRPQPGGFYGGWVTRDVVGPFKGESGTLGW